MSFIPEHINRLLQVIAAVCFLALGSLLICFATSGVIMLQLLAAGVNKYVCLGVAIVVAIGCNMFLIFNHKIRDFIKHRGVRHDD
jgi:hypothetical protein